MQQLSAQDASFVYTEQPHTPMHVLSIGVYDQSTAPDGKVTFKGILGYLEDRLHLARAFRQKLVRVPSDIDHPYWVEDSHFDLEYHVRHIALPKPGDWRQFCIQAARLHSRPLDLDRPLWELYVVEGLDHVDGVPPGSFGLVLKVHHAAVDGKSGVEMATAIHTQTAEIVSPPPPAAEWQPEEDPTPFELMTRASLNAVLSPVRTAQITSRFLAGLGRAGQLGAAGGARGAAPVTRFNGPISGHRVLDGRFFDFADIKPMRAAVEGATVNDVALSIVGGGLRAYLEGLGELPDAPLLAMTPVSVRAEAEQGQAGNLVSAMVVSLATDVADPVERLTAVHTSTSASKEMTQAIGARTLQEVSQLAPGALVGLGSRLATESARRGAAGGPVNTVVTNVPGPREPLYFAGARLVRQFGGGPVVDGMGLINVVYTYENTFVLSFTGDRQQMPDPAHYADCLQRAFTDLRAAA